MLGNDLYKIEANFELSSEYLKSLVLFYQPLIGNDALYLYQFFIMKSNSVGYEELNDILASLNISIDSFEQQTYKLNEYHLLSTYQKDNKYVFVFHEPLKMKEFIKDNVFVRNFILKTSGKHYQDIISNIYEDNSYKDFKDVSKTLSADILNNWSKENETYLIKTNNDNNFKFNTIFNIELFLKDIKEFLLPMKFRTKENMYEMARLADLYGISYDKMRSFIPKICSNDSNKFDIKYLEYLCMNSRNDYKKTEKGKYDISCYDFLMNLQNGKEVSEYDRKIINNLSKKYHLNISVINVLLEHSLNTCDNRLLENYIYPIASDMHRNSINNSKDALDRLSKPYNKNREEIIPTYDTTNNISISKQEEEEILRLMGKNE